MLDLLSSIANIIVSLMMLVENVFISLIDLISRIPTYLAFLTEGIALTPSMVQPFLLASISVYVIFLLIDR